MGNKAKASLIAVVGPTGSGKTALAQGLAEQFEGELISVDSKQVYRGMDIGTAKEKNLSVPQHLIDILNPGEKMNVALFQGLAYETIEAVLERKKLPILVGGSGLYVDAITEGYLFDLEHKRDPRYRVLKIAIELPREELAKRICQRTHLWIEQGILEEIKQLIERGVSVEWLSTCGMEYRYFTQHLQGALSLEEAEIKTNNAINQFIKRQYTWWRRHPDLRWVQNQNEAKQLVDSFLDHKAVFHI